MNAIIIIYLLITNTIALVMYGYDKYCAVNHKWRVPEKALISSAVIGGSLGAYLGMLSFRHKTNHRLFQISIPLLLVVQAIILMAIY